MSDPIEAAFDAMVEADGACDPHYVELVAVGIAAYERAKVVCDFCDGEGQAVHNNGFVTGYFKCPNPGPMLIAQTSPGEARFDTGDHIHSWQRGNNVLGNPFLECLCGASATPFHADAEKLMWRCFDYPPTVRVDHHDYWVTERSAYCHGPSHNRCGWVARESQVWEEA